VTMKPGLDISGLIKVDGNETVDLSAVRLFLESAGAMPIGGSMIQAKADGTFTATRISASKFFVRQAGMPDSTYLKSVRVGSQESSDLTLDLSSGAAGPIERSSVRSEDSWEPTRTLRSH